MQGDELAVEIAFADSVIVYERDRADACACQGLGGEAADAADPEDSDMRALKARKTVRTEQHDLTAELHVHVISPEYGESCRKAAFAE